MLELLKGNKNEILERQEPTDHIEILAIILTQPQVLEEYKSKLKPELFHEYANLYKLMLEVEEAEGLTFRGLAKRINHAERLKRLHEIKAQYITINRMEMLIANAKKELLRQELLRVASQMMDSTKDPDQLLRMVQTETSRLFTSESDEKIDVDARVDKWLSWKEEVKKDPALAYGMLTGLTKLDTFTKGFRKKDFIVLGGRTSMGKSALEVELSLLLTNKGFRGAIYSLEMSNEQLYDRMAANVGQYPLDKIMTGDINDYAMENIRENSKLFKKIYIDDTRGVSADYIVDSIRNLKRTQQLDFVVVDYLQEIEESGGHNDTAGSPLARVCRKLRAGAQQCDVAMFALSQVSRDVEKRVEKRPGNGDLSGSTGIETAADMIMMLYRDDYYDPDTKTPDVLEINITKQRNGRLGKVDMVYDKRMQKIYSR